MPTAPPKVCTCQGCIHCGGTCPNVVTLRGYCDLCRTPAHRKTGTRAERQKLYSSPRWQALKRQVKREQPFCNQPDCHELTADTDHIIPLAQGGAPYDRQNLQGLCAYHHAIKTRTENHKAHPYG